MRLTAVAAALACLACLAGPGLTQTADLDRLRLQSLQQQNMRAQEQQNALGRLGADTNRSVAEQQRLQTRSTLRALDAGRAGAAPLPDPGRIAADEQALRRLQDAELAAGNARLRAITPAR